jgi:urease accessory protein
MGNIMTRPLACKLLAAFAFTCVSTAAFAHVGNHSIGLAGGIAHPMSGLDHVLAMLAVGLWASQIARPACWLLPLIFPAVMALGALIGAVGVPLLWVEPAIAASVLVFGVVIALALRPSFAVSAALIALFALVHGYGHGVEMPAQGSALAYGAGFIASTLALHAVGFAIGMIANRAPLRFAARGAGAAIATIGALLLLAA